MENLLNWLHRVGGLRDGLLVLIGAVYILGYGVWSFNAYVNHLGPLPALQLQYFVAGFIPAMILAAFWLVTRYWIRFVALMGRAWRDAWVVSRAVTTKDTQAPEMIAAFKKKYETLYFPWPASKTTMMTIAEEIGAGFPRKSIGVAILFFLPIAIQNLAILALLVYAVSVYRQIPQEFGGIHPRCAYLEIDPKALSPNTRLTIAPTSRPDDRVVRSVQLDVPYESADRFLVRPHGNVASVTYRHSLVYEIRRADVKVVVWC